MVLEAIYVVRHGVSLPILCPLEIRANMSEGECSRGGNSSISMSVLLGTNIEGIRGAFVIAGARSLRCVLFGRHLQEGMAYRLVHKMLHATVSDDDFKYCDRLLTEIVPFQLGRRSRDWRVQQHRSFADRHSLRSSTRQLRRYTGRATGPAPSRH